MESKEFLSTSCGFSFPIFIFIFRIQNDKQSNSNRAAIVRLRLKLCNHKMVSDIPVGMSLSVENASHPLNRIPLGILLSLKVCASLYNNNNKCQETSVKREQKLECTNGRLHGVDNLYADDIVTGSWTGGEILL